MVLGQEAVKRFLTYQVNVSAFGFKGHTQKANVDVLPKQRDVLLRYRKIAQGKFNAGEVFFVVADDLGQEAKGGRVNKPIRSKPISPNCARRAFCRPISACFKMPRAVSRKALPDVVRLTDRRSRRKRSTCKSSSRCLIWTLMTQAQRGPGTAKMQSFRHGDEGTDPTHFHGRFDARNQSQGTKICVGQRIARLLQ